MADAELRVSSSVPNLPRISANGLDEPEAAPWASPETRGPRAS